MSKFLSYLKANPTFREEKNQTAKSVDLTQGSWTRTTLEVRDLQTREGLSGNGSFSLTLRLEELDENMGHSGKNQNSGHSQIHLTLEVEGKELALFSGLLGRRLNITGFSPGKLLSHEDLLERNLQLEEQLEELLFQLQNVRDTLGIRQGPELRELGA